MGEQPFGQDWAEEYIRENGIEDGDQLLVHVIAKVTADPKLYTAVQIIGLITYAHEHWGLEFRLTHMEEEEQVLVVITENEQQQRYFYLFSLGEQGITFSSRPAYE